MSFNNSSGQWYAQACDDNGANCETLITSGNIGTTMPFIIAGAEMSPDANFGSVAVSRAVGGYMSNGHIVYAQWGCYDSALIPWHTLNSSLGYCSNNGWTAYHNYLR